MAKSAAYKKYLAKFNHKAKFIIQSSDVEVIENFPTPKKGVKPKKVLDILDKFMEEVEIINITEIPETVFEEE